MLVGSRAAAHWFSDFRDTSNSDIDRWEYLKENTKEVYSGEEYPEIKQLLDKYGNPPIAPPELLFAMKLGHSFWPLTSYGKTLYDIEFFQKKGIQHCEEDYQTLYPLNCRVHGAKVGKLGKSNNSFFKNGVKYKYNHDDIHNVVKYYNEPMYLKMKTDKSLALTSWALFSALSHEDQIKAAQEETMVIALERFLIPNNFKCMKIAAWRNSLKLLITSLWRGEWAKFLVLNYKTLKALPEKDFILLFDKAVKQGKIRAL